MNDIVDGHDDEVEIHAPNKHMLSRKFLICFEDVDGQNMLLLWKERSEVNFKTSQELRMLSLSLFIQGSL